MQDKVCLLITVFNRSNQLRNSLLRLSKLSLPDEILIINDGGGSSCEDVVNSFKDKLPIKYIYNHNPTWSICSYARNIGIKNTDCEIIITSEPEILFCSDVICQMLNYHKEMPNNLISAGTVYHGGAGSKIPNLAIENPINYLKSQKVNISSNNPKPKDPNGFCKVEGWQATYTALYRKEWIESVGYWDEQFPDVYGVDDIDIATRIRIKLGINQKIMKDIEVIHQYHERPIEIIGKATLRNMEYFESKKLSVNGVEDKNNPHLIANKGVDVGIIKLKE